MGVYLRRGHYYFRKQIQRKVYYQALKLRRGQEALLSGRLKQVEEEMIAKHFGLDYDSRQSILFSDYLKRYLEAKTHKKSLDRDRQRLIKTGRILGDIPLRGISSRQIEKLEISLASLGIGTTTINRYMELLRHFLNMAKSENLISSNPLENYEPYAEDQKGRALTKGEIGKVLAAALAMKKKPRGKIHALIHDLILLALNTAMRLSEILNLRKSYIRGDVVYYPMSKTKSRRRVPGGGRFQAKLIVLNETAQAIIASQDSPDDFVFNLNRRDPNVVFRSIHLIRKRTGIPDFTFHQLRHTASTIVASQSSLASARVVLGHSDIRTTLRYTHPGLDEQRKTVSKLGNYFKDVLSK